MARESFNNLMFQLGELARERLAGKPNAPRSIDRVFRAEELLETTHQEMAALEAQMNDEDAAFQDAEAQDVEEREQLNATVQKFRRAVDAIEGRVKTLRKTLGQKQSDLRYARDSLVKTEARFKDLEMGGKPDVVEAARQNLKKQRLGTMRLQREVEDLEAQLSTALEPTPGQPGAAGIVAYSRLLALEDEAEARKAAFKARMAELDRAIGEKEADLQQAEDYLDQAHFLLGQECYAGRLPDPSLAPLYPKVDKVA